ncbi:unnamed protein product [Polarella glacialis]|uniref:Translation elongation factor P/YeiP central domain-containing protein n=1 Tax=Polarella glacialis TaxID=89957 RepID=A0A813JXW4_POLGL|nr:unnamed protein product [Polarella glacialis]
MKRIARMPKQRLVSATLTLLWLMLAATKPSMMSIALVHHGTPPVKLNLSKAKCWPRLHVAMRATTFDKEPGDLKKGMLILVDGVPYEVIECFTRKTVMRNLERGTVVSKTWTGASKLQMIMASCKAAVYAFLDEVVQQHVFMDCETFEEVRIGVDILGDMGTMLAEGMEVDLKLYDERVVQIGFKSEVIEEVVAFTMKQNVYHAKPGKCNRKFVLLSNGDTKAGPHTLEIGDKVVIDPRTKDIIRKL